MRILLCDHHVVFAESLAHLLAARGNEVVAVTLDADQTLEVLRREAVDVVLLDVVYGGESVVDRLPELRRVRPQARLVLLCDHVDGALVAAVRGTGVHGIIDKRQPVADLIDLLGQPYTGEAVIRANGHLVSSTIPAQRGRPEHDAHRLAAFLTPRERQVLSALVRGDDTGRLAHSLGIASATARCHIQSVLTKMGAHSRLEVATTAVRAGMVSPQTGEWLIPV
jgi:two-component system nitrate/nitrite response regulator NarL